MARLFDGKRVSPAWNRVLLEARQDGVRFTLNSGRRTLAEQRRLFHENMQFVGGRWIQRPGKPLTAFPSPTAPHIHFGLPAHAIDVDSLDGGETRLQRWLEDHGVDVSNPVPREAWHMVVSDSALRGLSRRIKAQHEREREQARREAHKRGVARKNGAHFVGIIWRQAQRAGLPFSLGLALIEQESGFRNVFGHDPTIFAGAGEVTQEKYRAYLKQRGKTKMQGVGPAQLTWWQLQDEADRRGGCWNPEANIGVAFDHLASLIKAHGTADGIRAYNGTGAAAERYSREVRAKRDRWQGRLA